MRSPSLFHGLCEGGGSVTTSSTRPQVGVSGDLVHQLGTVAARQHQVEQGQLRPLASDDALEVLWVSGPIGARPASASASWTTGSVCGSSLITRMRGGSHPSATADAVPPPACLRSRCGTSSGTPGHKPRCARALAGDAGLGA